MTDLELCAHPPIQNLLWLHGWYGCPLEKGHAGEHVFWSQSIAAGAKRGRNSVWVVDEHGHTLMHADFDGSVTGEELCALMAIEDAVRARRADQPAASAAGQRTEGA